MTVCLAPAIAQSDQIFEMQVEDLDGRDKYRTLKVSYRASPEEIKKVPTRSRLRSAAILSSGELQALQHALFCRHIETSPENIIQTKEAMQKFSQGYRRRLRRSQAIQHELCMTSGQKRRSFAMSEAWPAG